MPIYEYKCINPSCQHIIESSMVLNEELYTCMKCESDIQRVWTAPAIKVNGYNAKNGYSDDK